MKCEDENEWYLISERKDMRSIYNYLVCEQNQENNNGNNNKMFGNETEKTKDIVFYFRHNAGNWEGGHSIRSTSVRNW